MTRQSAPRPLVHNKSLASSALGISHKNGGEGLVTSGHQWSVTLVSQEPNSRVSSASLFSVHTPYFIFVSHLQMILPVLILSNIGALSLIAVKIILILSSAAMPGCMCCKGAAIFSCTNTDLQSTNTATKFCKYHSKYSFHFISERSGWFTSMIKFEMHRYMRNCIYGCSLPRVECSE